MRAFKYFALGLILGIGLTWTGFSLNGRNKIPDFVLPALSPATSGHSVPFAVIYDFYQSLMEGEEERLASLVTPQCWATLKNGPFLRTWQQRRQQDPSLRFVFFLIREQEIDPQRGSARARGSAELVSASKGNLSLPQTITLLKHQGQWKITAIKEQG